MALYAMKRHRRNDRQSCQRSFGIEILENRLVLATLTVNSLLDGAINLADSTVTLRDAIHAANMDAPASPGGPSGSGTDVIQLQNGLAGTILLNQGQLPIRSDMTINGPTTTVVTINGNNSDRIFDITDFQSTPLNVTIRDLVVTGGNVSSYSGGGILNRENLTIENCTISGNSTGVDGGGVSNRPLPYQNSPMLTVINSIISGNSAGNSGGGISNYGTLSVQSSSFGSNITGRDGGAIWNGGSANVQGSDFADNIASATFLYSSGGGFYNHNIAAATIAGSTFTRNVAGFGGAVRGAGTLTMNGSVLSDNDAFFSGGAVIAANGTAVLDNVTMTNNTANFEGGGLRRWLADVTITDSAISGNLAQYGGGINSYHYGMLTITGSTITSNHAVVNGGGIYNFGKMTVLRSRVSGNSAVTAGGAIFTGNYLATIDQTTIDGNNARFGGGITHASATTVIRNSTISGNVAADAGGGVDNLAGSVHILHSTITQNSAPAGYGGGVSSFGDALAHTRVYSSIISGNANSDVDFVLGYQNSFEPYGGFNLIGTGNAVGAFNQPGDQTGISDPLLGPLADNGGPTMTHATLPGSPAIDAGNPTFVSPPDFDQRGAPFGRIASGSIDVGAYELQDGDFDDDGLYNGLDLDLLVAVIAAGTHSPQFDLTGDLLVNLADRDAWLAEAGAVNLPSGNPYLLGDANVDGVVDGSDFGIWNANKFTSVAAWTRGDFNADGVVDGSDFGIWNANKFQSSDGLSRPIGTAPDLNHDLLPRQARPRSNDKDNVDCVFAELFHRDGPLPDAAMDKVQWQAKPAYLHVDTVGGENSGFRSARHVG